MITAKSEPIRNFKIYFNAKKCSKLRKNRRNDDCCAAFRSFDFGKLRWKIN